jgi:hypothetical protein
MGVSDSFLPRLFAFLHFSLRIPHHGIMKDIHTHKDGREWELFWNFDPPETNAANPLQYHVTLFLINGIGVIKLFELEKLGNISRLAQHLFDNRIGCIGGGAWLDKVQDKDIAGDLAREVLAHLTPIFLVISSSPNHRTVCRPTCRPTKSGCCSR